jgi:HSP20 family protein
MSNLFRRRPEDSAAIAPAEPMRFVRDFMRWDPFREMSPASWLAPSWNEPTFSPAFDVRETKESFLFKADLPGVKDKDVEVKLTGNRLTITGKRESEHEDKTDTYYAYERTYGSFTRAFTLPDGIDHEHVQASLDAGVLTVAVPKKAAAQGKTIAIKPEAPKS